MSPMVVGILTMAIPALLVGMLALGRWRLVFLFYLVLCAVGIGYLAQTGAAADIGSQALAYIGKATEEKDPGATPAPAQ